MDDAMVRAATYVLNEMPSGEILAVDAVQHGDPESLAARETWSRPENIRGASSTSGRDPSLPNFHFRDSSTKPSQKSYELETAATFQEQLPAR